VTGSSFRGEIRPLDAADRDWLTALIDDEWGLPVVSISGSYDPSTLPGFVALLDGDRVGAVTYACGAAGCEVITINAVIPGRGVGSALLAAARQVADGAGQRLWLITTNENLRAIAFYQRRGMDLVALHRNFVDVVRRHKPEVDAADPPSGIPFRHALEFSY
jgi:GNAT superfamily N-acetyltransferase